MHEFSRMNVTQVEPLAGFVLVKFSFLSLKIKAFTELYGKLAHFYHSTARHAVRSAAVHCCAAVHWFVTKVRPGDGT